MIARHISVASATIGALPPTPAGLAGTEAGLRLTMEALA